MDFTDYYHSTHPGQNAECNSIDKSCEMTSE